MNLRVLGALHVALLALLAVYYGPWWVTLVIVAAIIAGDVCWLLWRRWQKKQGRNAPDWIA